MRGKTIERLTNGERVTTHNNNSCSDWLPFQESGLRHEVYDVCRKPPNSVCDKPTLGSGRSRFGSFQTQRWFVTKPHWFATNQHWFATNQVWFWTIPNLVRGKATLDYAKATWLWGKPNIGLS
jgi:hypothetical protein